MADIEKVIKGLKYLHDKDTWREGIMIHDDHSRVRKQITGDAIAMLKEQKEGVKPFHKCIGESHTLIEDSNFDYCPYCGRKLLWNVL